jgi:hypothetical protein
MKQTAVEWLFAHLLPHLDWSNVEDRIRFRQLKQEALNMEKEQSIEFCQKKECNILNIINPLTQKQQECKVYIDSFYKKYKKLPSVSNVAEALGIKRTAAYHRMKKVKEYNSIYGGDNE